MNSRPNINRWAGRRGQTVASRKAQALLQIVDPELDPDSSVWRKRVWQAQVDLSHYIDSDAVWYALIEYIALSDPDSRTWRDMHGIYTAMLDTAQSDPHASAEAIAYAAGILPDCNCSHAINVQDFSPCVEKER